MLNFGEKRSKYYWTKIEILLFVVIRTHNIDV